MTVGHPATIDPPCDVESPIRAAGRFPIKTVDDPLAIISGGPAHKHISVTRAAGILPINTVGQPPGNIGPPTCGTTPVTIGQTCISKILAAKAILFNDFVIYTANLFLPLIL
jgi:hypothetical protein